MEHKLLNYKRKVILGIAISGYVFFYVIPVLMTMFFSLIEYGYEIDFVGLQQYVHLYDDDRFLLAFKNTLWFLIAGIPTNIIFSYVVAKLLIVIQPMFRLGKVPFLIPILLPSAAITYVWNIFFCKGSWINQVMLHSNEWENKWQDIVPILLLFLWKNAGYCILIFMAGFLVISKEIIEAGMLDGGNRLRIERWIILPMMRGPIFLATVITIVQGLKVGREIYLLYGDQIKDSLYMLPHYFRERFMAMNIEVMSSAAVVFTVLILIFIGMIYKTYKEKEK